jgi:hypothetical protein
MGPFQWFLTVYVFGGLTFIPLCIAAVAAFIFYTSPVVSPSDSGDHDSHTKDIDPASLKRDGDGDVFKSITDDLEEKFHRKHDSDVAAGYFAVTREWVPGGVNGKPPPSDKSVVGQEGMVGSDSPSVYQTMYRSIFERKSGVSADLGKDSQNKPSRVTGRVATSNIFYIVLRHGHLMLYDDDRQLEVRYVVSLDYHDVDIYAGDDEGEIPEGELWVKRNCIRLTRKRTQMGDKGTSLPFYLFAESLSDKEDFYHAILKNQQHNSDDIPEAEDFDVKYIVQLVQKLHSTEEQLQTRWLNAMIGRLFLSIYKTPELENFIREKLMKKISRVRKPTFITKLSLLKLDTGTAAPFFTNLRLKDLTVNGDCMIEANVEYTGNFRLEVGATARIDLGKRFGAREVEMVLAVTVKRIQGHALARFKPPPSNRIWFCFEKMPTMDLAVEPIVSSRQITYNIVLRQIENRIREVVAESLVLPFWDDLPFLKTEGQRYRGGVWKRERAGSTPVEIKSDVPEPEDEIEPAGSGTKTPDAIEMMKKDDRNMSTLSMPLPTSRKAPKTKKTVASLSEYQDTDDKHSPGKPPRLMRSPSFATTVDPKVTANHAGTESGKLEGDATPKRDSAANILKDLSARTSGSTPPGSSAGSPPVEGSLATTMKDRSASVTAKSSRESMNGPSRQPTVDLSGSRPETPADGSRPPSLDEERRTKTFAQQAKSMGNAEQRKQAIAAATATAQKWGNMGWGVLSKNRQKQGTDRSASQSQTTEQGPSTPVDGSPAAPMGRGQPLPPPGVPLPKPPKPTMMSSFMMPKRKPVLPKRAEGSGSMESNGSGTSSSKEDLAKSSPKIPPPLPDRRRRQSSRVSQPEDSEDDVLVVEAPTESNPPSPAAQRNRNENELRDDFFGHTEETDDGDSDHAEENEEPLTAIKSKSGNPLMPVHTSDLPSAEDQDGPSRNGVNSSQAGSDENKKGPPQLPPRTPVSPVPSSPTASIKRKPLNRNTSTSSSTSQVQATASTNQSGIEQGGQIMAQSNVDDEVRQDGLKQSRPDGPEDELDRSMSPHHGEAADAERRLGMMEGASWGGGYNE